MLSPENIMLLSYREMAMRAAEEDSRFAAHLSKGLAHLEFAKIWNQQISGRDLTQEESRQLLTLMYKGKDLFMINRVSDDTAKK